jgi:hypothetical protein
MKKNLEESDGTIKILLITGLIALIFIIVVVCYIQRLENITNSKLKNIVDNNDFCITPAENYFKACELAYSKSGCLKMYEYDKLKKCSG